MTSTPRDTIPGTFTVMIALKQMNLDYIRQTYSITRNECKGYILSLRENVQILTYENISIMGKNHRKRANIHFKENQKGI